MEKNEVLSPEPAPLTGPEIKPGLEVNTTAEAIAGGDVQITDNLLAAELNTTQADLDDARVIASQMSLETVRELMEGVYKMHENDPNFPHMALRKIKNFITNDHIFDQPEKHTDLIYEMKIEAALITNNSPYADVRAVVSNRDDPNQHSSTVRVWVIGLVFCGLLSFVNQFFSVRQPAIGIGSNVVQLLAYPIGKAWEKTLPDWGIMLPAFIAGKRAYGTPAGRISLNPGPFNRKEHMLITIMASVSVSTPYTDNIIWTQYLKEYFDQSFAGQFSYQILMALSTNLIGYGLAGLARRFLVYPSYCVWPTSLVTIAFNDAFHSNDTGPVTTPWRSVWHASRMKLFLISFSIMFVYFWFPNNIFTVLSTFNWMNWIAPNNVALNAVSGLNLGMGINPLPTFDWNMVTSMIDPLVLPFFTSINLFAGAFMATLVILAFWFTNTFNTGYLPINSNRVFNNMGDLYNISEIIDPKTKIFDEKMYQAYSPAYMGAGNITVYIIFFSVYPATIVYVILNHRYEIAVGMKNTWLYTKSRIARLTSKAARDAHDAEKEDGNATGNASITYQDVHNRLMSAYPEVSEFWYFCILISAIAFGVAGLTGWQTYTTPGTVFYGILLCLIFMIPIGIVTAVTGIEVTLNVLAEFIGGTWSHGNALAMNYFKAFGYVTCAAAIGFSNDLKLAHYVKIPPRHTFAAQLICTIVSSFVCTAVLNFQMNKIANVCTPEAADKMTCPGINTFFTAAVMWGTIGPKRVFGKGGQYTVLLVGFPIGVIVPIIFWYLQKKIRDQDEARTVDADGNVISNSDGEVATNKAKLVQWVRQIHPIVILNGGLYLTPYNISYLWPMIPFAYISRIWVRSRYLAFWSRYNYVLSASLSTAMALAGLIIFFAIDYQNISINWWGNTAVGYDCDWSRDCTLLTLADGEHFGPGVGEFK
ncbi:hypothetical protein SEPCBS119000_005949 [Sporothrix epigloea]|uniref:Oligopeptide transporter n=1 Tax=Sporothrix epigloea TaxID=1892477 RepID=A0ABP0E0B5_9PEZI